MGLRFRCLLIDHDDTAVDSTAAVHYPAHLEALRVLRPGARRPTKDQWLLRNFHGIMEYLVGDLGMNQQELAREFEIWRSWTTSRVPPFFPGFLELLADFRERGGLVAVDLALGGGRDRGALPRRQAPAVRARPHLRVGPRRGQAQAQPLARAGGPAARSGCRPAEALVVDDLKPGVLMAQATGCPPRPRAGATRSPRSRVHEGARRGVLRPRGRPAHDSSSSASSLRARRRSVLYLMASHRASASHETRHLKVVPDHRNPVHDQGP